MNYLSYTCICMFHLPLQLSATLPDNSYHQTLTKFGGPDIVCNTTFFFGGGAGGPPHIPLRLFLRDTLRYTSLAFAPAYFISWHL